ncbi:hypothetical protein LGM65_04270 [Burkholderia anthina]|uniref:hypothetical protein n=1 Tax=Burkholderia anthina TaxID=179879 RepID=UPI001CF48B91|nr:hypothetical protein [Burkholderia anthina]MCA8090111.1 hypothetical protein [Burkholderia anthina]
MENRRNRTRHEVQFSALCGLPLNLTTGVRSYRNMEIYGEPEHRRYDSTMYGFADMVSLTFGAPDVQRAGSNTVRLLTPESLLPGDMLVQANDRAGIATPRSNGHGGITVVHCDHAR